MKASRKKLALALLGGLVLLAATTELVLRHYFGFCDAVLMRADPEYEYIAQPNQNRNRFRRKIIYNAWSMRSEALRPAARKILLLGDSVVNGGHMTSHEQLASTLLSDRLSAWSGTDVQVLNISAGSWGPDNCAAYLRKHGTFDAVAMVLVISSHDARDTMTFAPIVGISKNCPDRQYRLACWELYDRYLSDRIPVFFQRLQTHQATTAGLGAQALQINTVPGELNPGLAQLVEIAAKAKIPLLIYLHAERGELMAGHYNLQGEEIVRFATEARIPLRKNLDLGLNETWYYPGDPIHLSPAGQEGMADILYRMLNPIVFSNISILDSTGKKSD